ncbi:MAG: response regulator transcription factor [Lachnospiraceae bacterium]|nr:response regulator transcription factor [Lachnospiraceae bacterium]
MDKKTYKILIAEDDEDLRELLRLYLMRASYSVLSAGNGTAAYELFEKNKVDLCIFDIMMPGMNGFDLTKKIREKSKLPIIILSAKDREIDKVNGLELGADDYLTKPFGEKELLARVKAALRRYYDLNEAASEQEAVISAGKLSINTDTKKVTKDGEEISLTAMEYKILVLLMKNQGRVFTKTQVYENISGAYFEADANTLMVHISKIREKIEDDPKNPVYLKTVRGLGYKFEKINI